MRWNSHLASSAIIVPFYQIDHPPARGVLLTRPRVSADGGGGPTRWPEWTYNVDPNAGRSCPASKPNAGPTGCTLRDRMNRACFRATAVFAGFLLALLLAEGAVRIMDGYALWPIPIDTRVPAMVSAPADTDDVASGYARKVALAAHVDASWYGQDPPPIRPYPIQPWVLDRLKQPGNESRLFEFNRAFLEYRICRDVATSMFGSQESFLYFNPIETSLYPSYRHLRQLSAPGWFTTNAFGWRGPDLPLDKPVNTIRVAFVGASTTVGAYAFPSSYPEFIGHWLNLWSEARGWPLRFEIINAARTGIDSHSIAAIVRDELVPIEPDLVVYYEGIQPVLAARVDRLSARAAVSAPESWSGPPGGETAFVGLGVARSAFGRFMEGRRWRRAGQAPSVDSDARCQRRRPRPV